MLTTGGEIKLIDFGLCIDVTAGGSTHMCGSPYWMSPEMIKKDIHGLMVRSSFNIKFAVSAHPF